MNDPFSAYWDLAGKAPKDGQGWITVRCPCHDDRHPSLGIKLTDDNELLVKCHAGCDEIDIREALGLAEVYNYYDEDGTRWGQEVKLATGNGKRFFVRRPDPRGGWINNWRGMRRTLWNLPVLLNNKPSTWIAVVEGPKDASNLSAQRLLATTNPGGAGKWRPEYSETLRNRLVFIIPDNDEPGRKHAEEVARSLRGVAKRIRIVQLPDLGEGEDVSDWLERGGMREQLIDLVRQAPDYQPTEELGEPIDVSFAELEPDFRAVRWLWYGRIPIGKLTLLEGDPDLGKSWLTAEIAARISTGRSFPPSEIEGREPGNVLLLSGEDDPLDTIGPRLREQGADLLRVRTLAIGKDINLVTELDKLKSMIVRRKLALVIVDPVSAYLGDTKTYVDAAVRGALKPLQQLAAQYDVAFLLIRHLTKGARDRVIYRGQGSIGFIAACRSCLLADYHPEDTDPTDPARRRVLACSKHNVARPTPSLVFDLADERITWRGETPYTAYDLGGAETRENRTEVEEAREFLRETLRNGSRNRNDVYEEGREVHDFSDSTLKRARKALNVKTDKVGKHWVLSLPEDAKSIKETIKDNGPLGPLPDAGMKGTKETISGPVGPLHERGVNKNAEDSGRAICKNCRLEVPADELNADGWCAMCVKIAEYGGPPSY